MRERSPARVLVVNCGSGSVQVDVVDPDEREEPVLRLDHHLDEDGGREALAEAVGAAGGIDAVAHRLVHGGVRRSPTRLAPEEVDRLRSLTWLAPLHLPPALDAAEELRRRFPEVAAVACFDTEFHDGLEPAARTLAVPARWRDEHGVERYGFHGPGHAWATERTAALLGRDRRDVQLVTAHLGGGSSAAAVRGGRSVDTTMGLTPLGGMAMTTRTGSLDPGILLRLVETGSTGDRLAEEINRHAGLVGISGTSSDLRDLYPAADAGDAAARLAIAVYARGVAHGIAAMAASLDRFDAVTFTGGAGAGSARLRTDVCRRLGVLGVELDPSDRTGELVEGEALVHAPTSAVPVAVVAAREATVIARSARRALAG